MISVRNRRMIVPPEERTLGIAMDNNSSVRVFSIPRYSAHDIDLSAMAFFLEFRYEDGTTNETAFQDMIVNEESIQLTWQILSTDLKDEGTVLLQLKANDMSGTVKWRSYIEPFYVGDCIDAAGNYTGDLSAYEALVTRCVLIENAEVAREAAEEARQTSETGRVAAEALREQNTTIAINNTNAAKDKTIEATTSAVAKISDVEERFNRLTIEQQQDAEVIDARKGKPSLKLKIDDIDTQLMSISINVKNFGVIGDGVTDDTVKLQEIIDTYFPKYSTTAYNFYTVQSHPVLFIPSGRYRITSTLDLSFRNDLVFDGPGILVWDGADDGLMLEMKCSARVYTQKLKLDLNSKAGTGIHQSGDGTSDGNPTKDRLAGKGNSSQNRYYGLEMIGQLPTSSKAMFDTIPYETDTLNSFYYSMDDSSFYTPQFRTGGLYGFAMDLGSSTISLYSPLFATPNGIKVKTGGTVALYSPMFGLQVNDKGCIYIPTNQNVGSIEIYNGYMENTTKGLINFDSESTGGSIQLVRIAGGLFSQNELPEPFINIPQSVNGKIVIDNIKCQSALGGINAPNSILRINDSMIGGSYTDYGVGPINVKKINVDYLQTNATYRGDSYCDMQIAVDSTQKTSFEDKIFKTIDEALLYISNIYNGKAEIYLVNDATVFQDVYINTPNVKILSSNNSKLTFSAHVNVHGYLELASIQINQTIDTPIQPFNGTIRINSCTINATSGQSIVKALTGKILINDSIHNTGSIIDASYNQNNVEGTLMLNTYNSIESVVKMGSIPTEIYVIDGGDSPSSGKWEKGTKFRSWDITAGSICLSICTVTGAPGTWKAYGTIQA